MPLSPTGLLTNPVVRACQRTLACREIGLFPFSTSLISTIRSSRGHCLLVDLSNVCAACLSYYVEPAGKGESGTLDSVSTTRYDIYITSPWSLAFSTSPSFALLRLNCGHLFSRLAPSTCASLSSRRLSLPLTRSTLAGTKPLALMSTDRFVPLLDLAADPRTNKEPMRVGLERWLAWRGEQVLLLMVLHFDNHDDSDIVSNHTSRCSTVLPCPDSSI